MSRRAVRNMLWHISDRLCSNRWTFELGHWIGELGWRFRTARWLGTPTRGGL